MREIFRLVGKIALDGTVELDAQLSAIDKQANKVSRSLNRMGRDLNKLGKELSKYVTAPLVALGAVAAKASIDFESAFAGVIKTVDATDEELAEIRQGIRDMAKEIPTAATEIAGIAEAAGQLGIKTENILSFTRVMADMGEATNMSAEEAATALARLANITQMPQENFDRLGSTIVALGNNLATTESEIVDMALRLAGAGAQVGMTEAQILSMAGALSSVGIEAQAGGSAISKVMVDMQLAVETNSDRLRQFAAVAGMSADQFSQAFREDAASAIIAFIEGLGQAEAQGTTAIKILDDMGITEVRLRDALLRAAGAGDLFANSLKIGSEAWEENLALTKEAESRYGTAESKLKIMWNRLKDIAITIGDAVVPVILDALDAAEPFVNAIARLADWFNSLNPGLKESVVMLAALAASYGPVLMAAGKMVQWYAALIPLMAKLRTGQLSLNAAMKANPIGMVVTAIYLLITAGILLWKNWDSVKNFFLEAWDVMGYGAQQSISQIKLLFFSFVKTVLDGINIVAKYIPGLNDAIDSARARMQELIDTEKESIQYRRQAREETKAQKKAWEEAEKEAEKLKNVEEQLAAAQKEQTEVTVEQTEAFEDLSQKREQFEKEWSDKLFRETASRVEILKAERDEALAQAEELGAKKADILAYYEKKIREVQEEEAQARADFEKEWSDKVFKETTESRLDLLEVEKQEALAKARELGASTADIEKYYSLKRQEIIEEEIRKREDFEKEWNRKLFESTADRMEILEVEMQEALAKAAELGAKEVDIVAYYEQKKRELRRETFNSYLSTASDILGRLDSIFGQHYTNRNAELDNWYQKQKEVIEASQMSEEEKEAALKQLDEERDARKREMARKQAASEKASSLFSIAINTARAAIEALPNLVLSGIVTAMGAAQAALVAAEPLPALKTGGLAVGEVTAIVGDTPKRELGELILPMRTGVEMLADMLIGKLSQVALPRPAFAMAGGVSNAYDNRTEVHLHVGTLIADEPGLKKLERKLAEIRLMENRRRGVR